MANTTDVMITTFFDDEAIDYINKETGLNFRQLTDGENVGGSHVLSFKAYGICTRCIGLEKINQLIEIFKSAPFSSPKYTVMIISDDNNDDISKIITLNSQQSHASK